jgi:beta-galactosidase
VKIGEGANLMGYYMYHGGSNPLGKLTTLEEPGYAVISYDFQAPLGEFGKCSPAWAGLRQLHSFLADFGDLVATTVPVLGVPIAVPADPGSLRVALRSDGERGFLVINNHQRYVKMPERRVRFAVKHKGGTVTFPDEPAVMAPSVTAIWPVNMPLLDAVVTWATVQPLMKLSCDGVPRFVFAATPGVAPELMLSGVTATRASAGSALPAAGGHRVHPLPAAPVEVETAGGAKAELLVLSAEDALAAFKVKMAGGERMALCPSEGWQDGATLTVRARGGGKVPLSIYPAYSGELFVGGRAVKPEARDTFSVYALDFGEVPPVKVAVEAGAARPEADTRYRFREVYKVPGDRYEAWRVAVDPGAWKGASDLVLGIKCVADTMRLYLGGNLVADQLWKNVTWEVGLKRWRRELEGGSELILVMSPWQKNAEVFLDERPAVTADATTRLDAVWVAVERKVTVALP